MFSANTEQITACSFSDASDIGLLVDENEQIQAYKQTKQKWVECFIDMSV